MGVIGSLIIFCGIEFLAEMFFWGTGGYLLFRLLGVKEEYWIWDCLGLCVVFIFVQFWFCDLMINLDLSVGNKEVLDFFDNDINSLFRVEIFDIFSACAEIFFGYWIGKLILKKLKRKEIV